MLSKVHNKKLKMDTEKRLTPAADHLVDDNTPAEANKHRFAASGSASGSTKHTEDEVSTNTNAPVEYQKSFAAARRRLPVQESSGTSGSEQIINPPPYDVLLGREGVGRYHFGDRLFREMVREKVLHYQREYKNMKMEYKKMKMDVPGYSSLQGGACADGNTCRNYNYLNDKKNIADYQARDVDMDDCDTECENKVSTTNRNDIRYKLSNNEMDVNDSSHDISISMNGTSANTAPIASQERHLQYSDPNSDSVVLSSSINPSCTENSALSVANSAGNTTMQDDNYIDNQNEDNNPSSNDDENESNNSIDHNSSRNRDIIGNNDENNVNNDNEAIVDNNSNENGSARLHNEQQAAKTIENQPFILDDRDLNIMLSREDQNVLEDLRKWLQVLDTENRLF